VSLRDLDIQDEYRPGHGSLVQRFLVPVLGQADAYWRAVGYFSSSIFELIEADLWHFAERNGTIRLITSVELSAEDIAAIEAGLSRRDVVYRRIQAVVREEFSSRVTPGAVTLARLVELRQIEIKIAVATSSRGIYHEKLGLIFDGEDYVAFAGSTNESRRAYEENYECVDTFTSWSDSERARLKLTHFEQLWSNTTPGVEVFPFPEAARLELLRIIQHGAETPNYGARAGLSGREDGSQKTKWRHQDDALQEFLEAERGVLNMATGTGKTRTALKIIEHLFNNHLVKRVIVSTRGDDLLRQWHRAMREQKGSWNRPAHIYQHFDNRREGQAFLLETGPTALLISRSFLPALMPHITLADGPTTVVVHDEVHGLGSPANRNELDGRFDHIRFRLGLSATPEREYDDDGNAFIEANVGPEIYHFGLADAIRGGILAPFKYYPLHYTPSDEDRQRVAQVFKRQAARLREGKPMSEQELAIEIASVHKTSKEKLPAFRTFISMQSELLERSIVFAETIEYARLVLAEVHRYRPDFHSYFGGEDEETLARFARGELQCLVACHRLSEGIDIKSLRSVILFSSARARLETIQRIGRCLRTDPDDPAKVSSVVDFIRSGDEQGNTDTEREAWLMDLARVRPEEVVK
jgi:superfamily II DNA or RNA helicase